MIPKKIWVYNPGGGTLAQVRTAGDAKDYTPYYHIPDELIAPMRSYVAWLDDTSCKDPWEYEHGDVGDLIPALLAIIDDA